MLTENIETLKTIFSQREPYQIVQRLGSEVIIFETIFLNNLREALSSGCMIKMSEESFKLTNDYVSYVDGALAETPILKALDSTLVDIVDCTFVDRSNECTLNSVHEFNECGV